MADNIDYEQVLDFFATLDLQEICYFKGALEASIKRLESNNG